MPARRRTAKRPRKRNSTVRMGRAMTMAVPATRYDTPAQRRRANPGLRVELNPKGPGRYCAVERTASDGVAVKCYKTLAGAKKHVEKRGGAVWDKREKRFIGYATQNPTRTVKRRKPAAHRYKWYRMVGYDSSGRVVGEWRGRGTKVQAHAKAKGKVNKYVRAGGRRRLVRKIVLTDYKTKPKGW